MQKYKEKGPKLMRRKKVNLLMSNNIKTLLIKIMSLITLWDQDNYQTEKFRSKILIYKNHQWLTNNYKINIRYHNINHQDQVL